MILNLREGANFFWKSPLHSCPLASTKRPGPWNLKGVGLGRLGRLGGGEGEGWGGWRGGGMVGGRRLESLERYKKRWVGEVGGIWGWVGEVGGIWGWVGEVGGIWGEVKEVEGYGRKFESLG